MNHIPLDQSIDLLHEAATYSRTPLAYTLTMLDAIQRILNFEGHSNPQFGDKHGLGRVGVAGFITGLVFGVHLSLAGCCLVVNGLVLSRTVSGADAELQDSEYRE